MSVQLFARSLHPELFDNCGIRLLDREQYTLSVQITTTGHLIAFRHDRLVISEVCSSIHQPLPNNGRMLSQSIDATHSGNAALLGKIQWESEFQIECLDSRLFMTIQQQLKQTQDMEGIVHHFAPNGRIAIGGISYVNVQAFRRHVLIKAFHTFPDTSSVVKCNSKVSLIG